MQRMLHEERMHEGGASREATNDHLKKRFGEDQWVRRASYFRIIKRGREHGDPGDARPQRTRLLLERALEQPAERAPW